MVVPIFRQFTEVEDEDDEQIDLAVEIRRHVEVLNSSFSDAESAREAVEEAASAISDLAKTGTVVLHLGIYVGWLNWILLRVGGRFWILICNWFVLAHFLGLILSSYLFV